MVVKLIIIIIIIIAAKMKNACVAFKILLDGTNAPKSYQRTNCHMIFKIKMEDF